MTTLTLPLSIDQGRRRRKQQQRRRRRRRGRRRHWAALPPPHPRVPTQKGLLRTTVLSQYTGSLSLPSLFFLHGRRRRRRRRRHGRSAMPRPHRRCCCRTRRCRRRCRCRQTFLGDYAEEGGGGLSPVAPEEKDEGNSDSDRRRRRVGRPHSLFLSFRMTPSLLPLSLSFSLPVRACVKVWPLEMDGFVVLAPW